MTAHDPVTVINPMLEGRYSFSKVLSKPISPDDIDKVLKQYLPDKVTVTG